MQVPLLDLKVQYQGLKDQILPAVEEVLTSQRCIGGPKVEELEQQIAQMCQCSYAVGVSSGTDALLNSLMSLDIGQGDEVITSTFTFFATAGAVHRVGATPVFVDIDPVTFNMDPARLESSITSRTKAIIPVHLFGQMADMDEIMAIANKHGLYVIEDAAQSITSTYKDRQAGSIGTCGCFSFFPSKNLGAAGDGGMVVTNDKQLYDRLMIMRNHGSEPKYYHSHIGGNFRLDPIQAVVLMVKLPHLYQWSQGRRRNAAFYDERFAGTVVQTPVIREDRTTIYNQYTIRVPRRDELRAYLQEHNIGVETYYPVPLHLQECFASLGYKAGDMPHAEQACKEVLALPIYPELTDEMKQYVADTILAFYDPA